MVAKCEMYSYKYKILKVLLSFWELYDAFTLLYYICFKLEYTEKLESRGLDWRGIKVLINRNLQK